MGGEYEFSFISGGTPFDLKKYQQFVLQLRDKYHNHPECEFYRTEEEMHNTHSDNILAKFKYQCSRHTTWEPDHGTWNILWDPSLDARYSCDNTHGRCSEYTFHQVHKQLVAAFPGKFHIYDDDVADYARGREERGYYDGSGSGSVPDYSACDGGCGYCGKCDY